MAKDTGKEQDFGAAFSEASGGTANQAEAGTGAGTETGTEIGTETAGTGEGAGEGTGTVDSGSETGSVPDGGMPVEDAAVAGAASGKDEQRMKSWEGRLKAEETKLKERMAEVDRREQELSAREASNKLNTNVDDTQSTDPDNSGNDGSDSSYEEIKEKMDLDFGPDFGNMLEVMIKALINRCKPSGADSGEVETLKQKIEEVVDGFSNQLNHLHRNTIADAHEDFEDIVQSPEFQNWCENHPKKEHIDKVCQSGTAGQIIKMLNEFKNSKQVKESDKTQDDAAHGVASNTVLILPESPGKAGSFHDAFSEAAARK